MRTLSTMVAVLVVVIGLQTVVSAADCEIPAFLMAGKTYNIATAAENLVVKLVEIDRKGCWIKIESAPPFPREEKWINLWQVYSLKEIQN